MAQETEIGLGKKARASLMAWTDISIVPSRRTRDPQDGERPPWQVDAYEFDIPVIGAPMGFRDEPTDGHSHGQTWDSLANSIWRLWNR